MSKRYDISNENELMPMIKDIMSALEKGRFVICDVKTKSSKTLEQLGYYYGVILPRVQAKFREDGNFYSLSELNDFFNDMFYYEEVIINDRIVKRSKSKSGATKEEMTEFLNQVIVWCETEGIHIPEPQQLNRGELK